MAIKVLTVFLAVIAIAYSAAAGSNAFENIDFEDYKENPEHIDDLLQCFLKESDCNESDAAIRERASQIEATTCESCTEKEKEVLRELFQITFTKRPLSTSKLINFFNKSGKIFKILDVPALGKHYATIIQDQVVKGVPAVVDHATAFLSSDDLADVMASAQDFFTGLAGKRH